MIPDFEDEGPLAKVEPEEAFDERSAYLDEMGRTLREGITLQVELEAKGPLYEYIVWRWQNAAQAMADLTETDPADVAEITRLQTIIREWKEALRFLNEKFAAADEAESHLTEEENHPQPTMETPDDA